MESILLARRLSQLDQIDQKAIKVRKESISVFVLRCGRPPIENARTARHARRDANEAGARHWIGKWAQQRAHCRPIKAFLRIQPLHHTLAVQQRTAAALRKSLTKFKLHILRVFRFKTNVW